MKENELRKQIRIFVKRMGLLNDIKQCFCNCCREITFLQCHIITEIGNSDNITSKELSAELNVDKSLISRSIKELKDIGYVNTVVSSMDKRCFFLSLTDKGLEQYDRISSEMMKRYMKVLSKIPDDKVSQIIESFEILNECLFIDE